ncbi:FRG domain-containing protein [Novosphingobium sp. BL-8A]|uniref:FRG domain-containing protein n=1 Tax=Novosphingobium sp. BL-8A TaxID=3127639 RepID=UPI003756F887
MDRLKGKFISFLADRPKVTSVTNAEIRKDPGHLVTDYLDLASKIGELQFRLRQHVIVFRGQGIDHRDGKGQTMLRPTMFRPDAGSKQTRIADLETRFSRLEQAEKLLLEIFEDYRGLGKTRMRRQRLLRWAVLQHYEICPTPLLDVSQSLRIAASFATVPDATDAYLYAIAIPNISGAVTASAEAAMQVVRLNSVCPPTAIRAHVQEGYLLGEYPEFSDASQHKFLKPYQVDFGRRLVGKFRFNPKTFWAAQAGFPLVSHNALYPKGDGWFDKEIAALPSKLAEEDKKEAG